MPTEGGVGAMELRAFAEAVLFSADLDTKLTDPGTFTDADPGAAVRGPVLPGRPTSLPLIARRPIPKAPTPRAIHHERVRGEALHTFAHHELQALELMALALLRFPDAPAGFRMGLARIVCDEQRHFRLYQARAERWGVAVGDVGVGHFFWSTVADLDSLPAFLAALSLTYEQANLDFAAFWKPAFAAVDDPETVDVLQTVYEDEIGHVAHGVHWFERLQGSVDFASYRAALPPPLNPGRAKGPILDREARLRAGLSPDFVDEIEIGPVTLGRAGRVFTFDPFVEEHIAGRSPKANVLPLQADLASLTMFLAGRDDVVIAPRPSARTLLRLHRAGFESPTFADAFDPIEHGIHEPAPWGWSPVVCRQLGRPWDPSHAELSDKRWAFGLRQAFADAHPDPILAPLSGGICRSVDQVQALVGLGGAWVAKAPFSSSGQHRVRLRDPLEDRGRTWLERRFEAESAVVEPWCERVADLSVQIEVSEDGVAIVGLSRFWTAGSGAYRGAQIGPWTRGLAPEVARQVHGGVRGGRVTRLMHRAGAFVGEALRARGFRGPAGIDAMLVTLDDQVRLVPILEVNPRTTMGRIAVVIGQGCTGSGGWFFVSLAQIRAAGHPDLEAFRAAVEAIGVQIARGGLLSGVLCTTEPLSARQVLTVLCVGEDLDQARALWTGLGLAWPE